MKTLLCLYKDFVIKSTIMYDRATYIQNTIPNEEWWRVSYLTECLIANLWQVWCSFCRHVIILSCNGTLSRSNDVISSRHADNSIQRIGYEALCATRRQAPRPSRTIRFLRQEPTWGDQDKIIDIITLLNPANSSTLLSAFGLPLYGPKHLQIVRNACAHKNVETVNQVRSLTIHYSGVKISSPSDLAWQVISSNNTCGIYSWIEDLITIADQATITC